MQQTDKYKLNLIEKTDTFSPDPLNENMQKMEAAIAAETAARTSADSSLNQRINTLEAHKIYLGGYVGTGTACVLDLDFTPKAILIFCSRVVTFSFLVMDGYPIYYYDNATLPLIEIIPNGIRFSSTGSDYYNKKDAHYHYLAFV